MPKQRLIPVLAGGGTRLPAHVGVLCALEELDYRIDRLVGVSGGSIVAALYAAGRPLSHLRHLVETVDFRQFRGYSIRRLLSAGGLSDGAHFERWLDGELQGASFADLSLDLQVVATDVRSGEPVVFNRDNAPRLKVARAVRFSMGIPLLFTFESYRDHLMVDGSILAEDALYQDWTQGDEAVQVVYFRLRSARRAAVVRESRWFPLPGYLFMLIRTFMTSLSREYIDAGHWRNTIVIETADISPLEFGLSPDSKALLHELGYRTTRDLLPVKLAMAPMPGAPGVD